MMDLSIHAGSPVQPMAAGDYTRTRQLGIGDLLLENRIIFLDGPIHDGNANLIVMKLLYPRLCKDVKQSFILQDSKQLVNQLVIR